MELLLHLPIDHPVNAVFVGEHAEHRAPESLLQRHLDLTALRESVEESLGFAHVFRAEREGYGAIAVLRSRLSVRRHEFDSGRGEGGMHYPVAQLCRQTHFRRRFFPTHDLADLPAENALIEIEGLFASAAGDEKIGHEFHAWFSCSVLSEGRAGSAPIHPVPL